MAFCTCRRCWAAGVREGLGPCSPPAVPGAGGERPGLMAKRIRVPGREPAASSTFAPSKPAPWSPGASCPPQGLPTPEQDAYVGAVATAVTVLGACRCSCCTWGRGGPAGTEQARLLPALGRPRTADRACSRGTWVTRKQRGRDSTEVSSLCPRGAGSVSSPRADRAGHPWRGRGRAIIKGQPGPQGGRSGKCWTLEAQLTGMWPARLEVVGLCVPWSPEK